MLSSSFFFYDAHQFLPLFFFAPPTTNGEILKNAKMQPSAAALRLSTPLRRNDAIACRGGILNDNEKKKEKIYDIKETQGRR